MYNFIRLLAVIAMAGLTGACATVKIPPEKLQSIKTIAVVSDIDNELHLYFYGLTVFDTEHETAPIDGWQINDFVKAKVGNLLDTRYKVVPSGEIDRSTFNYSKWSDNATTRREKAFAAIKSRTPEADTYLIILPDTDARSTATVSRPVDNIGLMRRSIALRMPWAKYSKYGVYAAYTLFLVDASTGKLIAFRPGELAPEQGTIPHEIPFTSLWQSDEWPSTLAPVLKEHEAEVRNTIQDTLARSLQQTMQGIGLQTKP